VNGTMLGTESAWGFLLGTVWALAGGITLAAQGTKTAVAPQLAAG
jgi:hypothetical protein